MYVCRRISPKGSKLRSLIKYILFFWVLFILFSFFLSFFPLSLFLSPSLLFIIPFSIFYHPRTRRYKKPQPSSSLDVRRRSSKQRVVYFPPLLLYIFLFSKNSSLPCFSPFVLFLLYFNYNLFLHSFISTLASRAEGAEDGDTIFKKSSLRFWKFFFFSSPFFLFLSLFLARTLFRPVRRVQRFPSSFPLLIPFPILRIRASASLLVPQSKESSVTVSHVAQDPSSSSFLLSLFLFLFNLLSLSLFTSTSNLFSFLSSLFSLLLFLLLFLYKELESARA